MLRSLRYRTSEWYRIFAHTRLLGTFRRVQEFAVSARPPRAVEPRRASAENFAYDVWVTVGSHP
jgi:hypothetical protein